MKLTNTANTRVIPIELEYYAPSTVEEAIGLLSKEGLVPLAGGLDLIIWIKTGALRPRGVVNVKRIKELREVNYEGGRLRIGAAVRVLELEKSATVRERAPLLWRMAREFSSIQVRSMTTVGGNICSASPASDIATVAMALEGSVEIAGRSGRREIPLESFYLGLRKTALEKGELVTSVAVKGAERGEGYGYKRAARLYEDIAKVIVAARVKVQEGRVREAAVALGSVAPKVVRAGSVEERLVGSEAGEAAIREASELVVKDISPITDIRSTAEYRLELSKVLTRRALTEAVQEAISNA